VGCDKKSGEKKVVKPTPESTAADGRLEGSGPLKLTNGRKAVRVRRAGALAVSF